MPNQQFNTARRFILAGVTNNTAPYILNELSSSTAKDIIFVAKDRIIGLDIFETLSFLSNREIIFFPEWDTTPYDTIAPSRSLLHQRIRALHQATNHSSLKIIITTARAFIQRTIPKQELIKHTLHLETNKTYSRQKIINFLITHGYTRASCVTNSEEFAVRGSIIDVSSDEPGTGYRIDFFGDRIELIKKFNLASQATINTLDNAYILPSSELIISDKTIDQLKNNLFYKGYKTNFDLSIYSPLENFLPLFHQDSEVISDYLSDSVIVLDPLSSGEMSAFFDMAARVYEDKTSKEGILPPHELWLTQSDLEKRLSGSTVIEFSLYNRSSEAKADNYLQFQVKNLPAIRKPTNTEYLSEFKTLVQSQLASGKNVVISCLTEGSKDRIMRILNDSRIITHQISTLPVTDTFLNAAQVILSPIRHGAITNNYCLIAEEDIFGYKALARQKRTNLRGFEAPFAVNDIVVHTNYGIGSFQGLELLQLAQSKHDCLKVAYADNETLFVPIENMDALTRYACANDEVIKLDKLSGGTWAIRKARAKDKINEMAKQLMAIAAERSTQRLTAMHPNDFYEKFCADFPYIETEDQEKAIKDVIEDLGKKSPMDRLICGDTGFGKTEVVMRAAAIVISQNASLATRKMVAMICPTTLLCRQNYNIFQTRFRNTPARIVQLSRLVTQSAHKEAINAINAGHVDIVIGTHAMLSEKICYDRLALLIIDEEHRFGVAHKENLKALKKDTHIISLSATPIPRTLQMALTGIRELSLITSPPLGRMNTRISIISFDTKLIREALLKEKARGGQIFYICPRITDMNELETTLATIVPKLKIRKVHGQMAASDLNAIVSDFYDGKFDLLLSTSIVESGLDIPRANTIIVHRAELFGLAQLYQLKGRVGRSNVEAFAYFTVLPNSMTEIALKRLQILQNAEELGSGFSLASHDMELRGFGNLVGEKQAGHIKEIGLELYQQMFEEALSEIKIAEHGEDNYSTSSYNFSPQINIDAPILIPEEYIKDLDIRLELYGRIARLQNETEIIAIGAELIDRFGPIPQEVENLLAIVSLKRLCLSMFIDKINLGNSGISIKFLQSHVSKIADALLAFLTANNKIAKIKSNDVILLDVRIENPAKRIHAVKKFLENLRSFITL